MFYTCTGKGPGRSGNRCTMSIWANCRAGRLSDTFFLSRHVNWLISLLKQRIRYSTQSPSRTGTLDWMKHVWESMSILKPGQYTQSSVSKSLPAAIVTDCLEHIYEYSVIVCNL